MGKLRLSITALFGLILFVACAANPTPAATGTLEPSFPTAASHGTGAVAFPTAAPSPTIASSPTAAPSPTIGVQVSESTVTFKSYPFQAFLEERTDPTYNMEFTALNRERFDAAVSAQGTSEKSFRSVVLENQYLRLVFLPELGGRLYQITYKPTNQNLFYNNEVLKPTPWGPAQQGGWLAVGGMEWALPVNEHGYEWGVPWEYAVTQNADGATVTLTDSRAQDRVRARIQVTLPRDGAYVIVEPHIENPTRAPQRIQFWVNAMLALGGKTVAPMTQFYFPTDAVLVHSTADQFIPPENIPANDATAPRAPLSLKSAGRLHVGTDASARHSSDTADSRVLRVDASPQHCSKAGSIEFGVPTCEDLSWYANWQDYLGLFAADLAASKLAYTYVGAYNYETRLGVARVFPPQQAPGVKLFAFGHDFCCKDAFADDGSNYFELWGGLPRTFFSDDDVALAPGQAREWTEYWLPAANTAGISAAAPTAVLSLAKQEGAIQVSASSAIPRDAILVLAQNGQELKRWNLALTPERAFSERVSTDTAGLQLRLLEGSGNLILETP